MTINRQWLLAARPHGMVGPQNFSYHKKHIFLNIDFSNRDGGILPYMRY